MLQANKGALSQIPSLCPALFLLADVSVSPTPQEANPPLPSPEPAPKIELEPSSTEVQAHYGANLHLCVCLDKGEIYGVCNSRGSRMCRGREDGFLDLT